MSDSTNPNNDAQIVSNPATQTLFRFVSLRNPQLAKKDGNLKFIFRSADYKGVFDEALKEWKPELQKSKFDFLIEKVKSSTFDFGYIQRTEKAIKGWFDDLYLSSKKLIANGTLPAQEVNELKGIIIDYSNNAEKTKQFFGGLWDSIIYQIITQEDFYVKEILLQILQTIHYVKNYDSFSTETIELKKEEKEKEIATSKAVIPDYLLIDSAIDDGEDSSAQYFTVENSEVGGEDYIAGDLTFNAQNVPAHLPYNVTEEMQKRQNLALASYRKTHLEELKKDLLRTKKLYDKQYSQAYDLALQDYKTLIKPSEDSYNKQILQVEATFSAEMTEASKKLAISQVEKPEIPDFQFVFRKERDISYLQAKLSPDSLSALTNLISEPVAEDTLSERLSSGDVAAENIVKIVENQFVMPEDEYVSFDEIFELLNEKLAEINEQIYLNTEIEKQQYASVGGVLIPVNRTSAELAFTYQICAVKNRNTFDKYNFDLYINVPDSSWDISRIYHHTNGGSTNGYYLKEISGSTIILRNLYGNSTNVSGIEVSRFPAVLEMHLFFTNGKTAVFTTSSIQPDTCVSGNFSIEEDSDNPGNPSTPVSTSNSFVPKAFGIKRLGIADYLKVEQTTHAYVEGEVANIENIMAREYRSQSTRRFRKSETIDTKSSDTERERSTDTTTSSRFEMQSEISQILQEATDLGINSNVGYSKGGFTMNIAGSYANHRSKEDSMRQAVTQAQEITARALDRVVTKVYKERLEKMIEEFEENNTHGFDNRKGDQHVVGVYRWVDKLMKNRVWNYGKRMMFEFAIPQPSKLHTLAAASIKGIIDKPVDPRASTEFTVVDYTTLNNDNVLKHWLSEYNVEIEEKPADNKTIAWSYSFSKSNTDSMSENKDEKLTIPEGYKAANLSIAFTGRPYTSSNWGVAIGDKIFTGSSSTDTKEGSLPNVSDSLSVSAYFDRYWAGNLNVVIHLELFDEVKKQYMQKTFNAIIKAYEDALAEYNNKVAEENAKANTIKTGNPMFYRQIEQEVLKHNSIAYLVDDSVSKNNKVLGKTLYTGTTVAGFEVTRTGLDDYASLAKFMEQAFEWDIMSYNYYPYYWGKREDWDDMYQQENIDPLFRSFLRSGMARVVVTVRPGFEDAVQFYMSTGRLWNGGEVPVIGDPMYLSLVDEMKDVKRRSPGQTLDHKTSDTAYHSSGRKHRAQSPVSTSVYKRRSGIVRKS
jgi:hypothetical protein